mgnify:CR=1 FL=1
MARLPSFLFLGLLRVAARLSCMRRMLRALVFGLFATTTGNSVVSSHHVGESGIALVAWSLISTGRATVTWVIASAMGPTVELGFIGHAGARVWRWWRRGWFRHGRACVEIAAGGSVIGLAFLVRANKVETKIS